MSTQNKSFQGRIHSVSRRIFLSEGHQTGFLFYNETAKSYTEVNVEFIRSFQDKKSNARKCVLSIFIPSKNKRSMKTLGTRKPFHFSGFPSNKYYIESIAKEWAAMRKILEPVKKA